VSVLIALEGVPGSAIGLAVTYVVGLRRERAGKTMPAVH